MRVTPSFRIPARYEPPLSPVTDSSVFMSAYYLNIKALHMGCAMASVVLFLVRFGFQATNSQLQSLKALRILPHIVNTALLASAIMLTVIIKQRPFADDWVTVKLFGLIAYVVFGVIAMKPQRPAAVRYAALVAALATFAFLISVAVKHSPLGFFA
jgi:uncharacterized membrane protein SirB2